MMQRLFMPESGQSGPFESVLAHIARVRECRGDLMGSFYMFLAKEQNVCLQAVIIKILPVGWITLETIHI